MLRLGREHMVDLAAGEHGLCDCEHFTMNIPRIAKAKKAAGVPYVPRCKHIVACREWLADSLISRLRAEQKGVR